MKAPLIRVPALALLVLALIGGSAWCDAPIPANVLDPKTPPEAWNVIRLASQNVATLLEENRMAEIPQQISFCSPALRALSRFPTKAEDIAPIETMVARALVSVNAIARAGLDKNPGGAQSALESLRRVVDEIAPYFDPKVVGADIFLCPMHPDFLSDQAKTPCGRCAGDMIKRRIPYSFIYMKPGEPSVRITATASAPIEAGRKVEVKIRLAKIDRSPFSSKDLLLTHAEYIRLLINDPGLGDYHHVHPVATDTSGEYVFSFTPKKTAPYRIWADIVPTATGVQEWPFVDLPSKGEAEPLEKTGDRFTSSAGGYQFTLLLRNGNHLPPKAGEARQMSITVTTADGKPVTILQPVMNAFGYLVGFYNDFETVLHLHPTGSDILNPQLRGGPALGFMFFPPKPGLIRLYCQVLINDQMIFAPFDLNIVK